MLRTLLLSFLVAAPALAAASGPDGRIDPSFGSDGRTLIGYLESTTPQLQAIARGSTRLWLFGDDTNARNVLSIARLLPDGQPDTAFGPNADGRRRSTLPAGLIAQTQALGVAGALVQNDGKPVVFGGMVAVNGETGAFPGLVCRLAVAGNFDPSFGSNGCRTLRSFLDTQETCRVTGAAADSFGRLVAVGNCTGPAFAERPFVARLNPNGSLDTEFAGGLGLLSPAPPLPSIARQHYQAVRVLPDDRIAVLGDFVTTDTGTENIDLGLVQYDGGGSLDTSFSGDGVALARFDLGGDNADRARDLVRRADGRLLALGQATQIAPPRATALLAQWNADGTPDAGFGSGGQRHDDVGGGLSPGSRLRSIDVDGQGRIVVAGERSAPNPAVKPQAGTDFWLALPWVVPPAEMPRLLISADVPTSGLVQSAAMPDPVPFTVTPGLVTTVMLPASVSMDNVGDAVVARGVHVTAQAPISVNALIGRLFARDTDLVLPTSALGVEYRVQSWGTGSGAGSNFVVTATADNTSVSVVPSTAFGTHMAGVAFPVVLQRGQSYAAFVNAPGDLSGTRISSNKPVAVFGAHTCARVPDALDFCDPMQEQLLPVTDWGTVHVLAPFAGRTAGDVVRVYAQQNGTAVSFNGVFKATVDAGFFYETSLTAAAAITSSAPVAVQQYAQGCKADDNLPNHCIGDPLMLTALPTAQWASRYDAVVPPLTDNDYAGHYLTIVAPQAAIGDVRINDESVLSTDFSPVGASGYSVARIARTPGVWRVTAPQPIGVSVYGFAESESYGHPAAAATSGEDSDADDVVLRFRSSGQRDPDFGDDGAVFVDHAVAYGSVLPAFDNGKRAIVSGDAILVGTASVNGASGQDLMLAYRLTGDTIFRDGFDTP